MSIRETIERLAAEYEAKYGPEPEPPAPQPMPTWCSWCGLPAEDDHRLCPDCEKQFAEGYIVDRLTGRRSNGAERDGGRLWHLRKVVVDGRPEWKALCGAQPGRLSDWSSWKQAGQEATCPRCMAKKAKEQAATPA